MRIRLAAGALLASFGLVACGDEPAAETADETVAPTSSTSAEPVRPSEPAAPPPPAIPELPAKAAPNAAGMQISDGLVEVGKRSLMLECVGTGTPVVVYETGMGGGREYFGPVQDRLVDTTTVCTYDRANLGGSGKAPTPRTAEDVVGDVHGLLEAAGVPAPYVLVGSSAGADFVVQHARKHPDDVAAVLAWNPVNLRPDWSPRFNEPLEDYEIEGETRFLSGENDEAVDFVASAEQSAALPTPTDVPLLLLHSDSTQCEGSPGVCAKTYEVYLELGEDYAADWPGAAFAPVALTHLVHEANPDLVARLLEDFVESSRSSAG